MSDTLEYTTLGIGVRAFTTCRTLGRDRQRLCGMLGIDDSHLIVPHQTHQDEVREITDEVILMTADARKEYLEGVDAVMTNLTGVCVGVSTADCIPVLLYDETHHAVAAIHAGWKGTVARIVQTTVCRMQETYGTVPSQLKAVIGPGISQKNFEVGDEVYDRFAEAGFDMAAIACVCPPSDYCRNKGLTPLQEQRGGLYHLDLPLCNKLQLTDLGVKADNIHIEPVCTYDSTDRFFSARVEQKGAVKCGRNFNAIILL